MFVQLLHATHLGVIVLLEVRDSDGKQRGDPSYGGICRMQGTGSAWAQQLRTRLHILGIMDARVVVLPRLDAAT